MKPKSYKMIILSSNNKKEFVQHFNNSLPTEEQKHIIKTAGLLFEGNNTNIAFGDSDS